MRTTQSLLQSIILQWIKPWSSSADELKNDKELRGLLGTDMVRSKNGEYKIVVDREDAEVYKLSEISSFNLPFILALIGVFGTVWLSLCISGLETWKKKKSI